MWLPRLACRKPDADLQDALVEPADGARLGVPLVLDHLVALVVLAFVEEADPLQEPGRGAAVAGGVAFDEDLAQHRVEVAPRRLDAAQVVADDPFQHQRTGVDPGDRAQQGRPGEIPFAGRQDAGCQDRSRGGR